MNSERLYMRAPHLVQSLLVSLEGYRAERRRYSARFYEALAEYEATIGANDESIQYLSRARRALALERASRTPYYADLFREMGADWHELVDDTDFARIPITTKEAVLEAPHRFHTRQPLPSDSTVRTSGTTGAALTLLKDANAVAELWAVWWRYRRTHNIAIGDWCALFAGRQIMREDQGTPYWRLNRPGRELRFSIYHISRSTARTYVRTLNDSRISWIHGFSSAIANLARCMVSEGLSLDRSIDVVSLGGENVEPWQAEIIETAFGVRPIHHYGLTEQVTNISMCTRYRLHIDEDFAYTELAPMGVDSPHSRLIGTSFSMGAMPLLRYDTGDIVSTSSDASCDCGLPGRIVDHIDGRADETIRLPDGRLSGPRRAFRQSLNLAGVQIVQHGHGGITVNFVAGSGWTPGGEVRILAALRDVLGYEIPIELERVDRLHSTPAGKVRLVVHDD